MSFTRLKLKHAVLTLLAGLAIALGGGSVGYAMPIQDFSLGESQKTGDRCDARMDDHDPATQVKGAQAWRIQCRGRNSDFGRIYVFEGLKSLPAAFEQGLSQRATCDPAPGTTAGGTVTRTCASLPGKTPYVVKISTLKRTLGGDMIVVAEGQSQIADSLQHAIDIAQGKAPVVAAEAATAVVDTATMAPAQRAQNAYKRSQGWAFGVAANEFSVLALNPDVPAGDRADAYLNWALNESNAGHFDGAKSLFDKATEVSNGVHDPVLATKALNYQAMDRRNRRDFAGAVALAQSAITTARAGSMQASSQTVVIDSELAAALNIGTDFGLRTLTPQEKQRRNLAVLQVQANYIIGSASSELLDFATAHGALDEANRLLTNLDAEGSPSDTNWLKAEVMDASGRLAGLEQDPKGQLTRTEAGLTVLSHGGGANRTDTAFVGSLLQGQLLLEQGRAQVKAGQKDKAKASFEAGLKIFRDNRGSLGPSADAAEGYFELLLSEAGQDPARAAAVQEQFFAGMQSVVDVATAETVQSLSARLVTGDSEAAAKARQFEDAKRRMALVLDEQRSLRDAGKYTGDNQTRIEASLTALSAELKTTEQQLLVLNPNYNRLSVQVATIKDVQQALNPDGSEVYVKIIVLADHSYGLAISATQVVPYRINLKRSDIVTNVRTLRKPFDAVNSLPVFNVPLAHQMFADLFGPAAPMVTGAKHLIYEPDSSLFGLPAGVFVTDAQDVATFAQRNDQRRHDAFLDPSLPGQVNWLGMYDNVSWLGRTADISLSVSASGFIQTRNAKPSPAPKSFVGYGNPKTQGVTDPRMFSLLVTSPANRLRTDCSANRDLMATRIPPTPGITDIMQAAAAQMPNHDARLVLDDGFTDTGVEGDADIGNYRIVFFGTHGIVPDEVPCLPEAALVTSLSSDPMSDGFLSVSEIFDLKLNADLVVLAACNTGHSGPDTDTDYPVGGALDGLAQAFIYAGSRNLIVSHWSIDANATSLLTTRFFQKTGVSQADSLRQAQVAMMGDKVYAHPFYWAFFSVVGDGARPIPGL